MIAYGTVALAALAGAPHCIGMCGPFACAAGDRAPDQAAYHVGRIATYASLGALSGLFGHVIPGPPWVGAVVAAALLLWFSLVLAGFAPEPHLVIPGLRHLGARAMSGSGPSSRLLLGLVNGLLPCGLTWAALSVAVAAADPLQGAALMALFGVLTLPSLLAAAWGLRRIVAGSLRTRRILAALVLVTGLWSLGARTGVAASLRGEPVADDVPPCHAH
jgi:sulfite exporter TauE/SafE